MEQRYDPAGRSLLKTTGVLMIVFGVFGVLIYTLGLAAVLGLSYATSGVFSASADLVGMALLLAAAVTELITGILGIQAARRPSRAGVGRIVWCMLCLVLTLACILHIALRAITAPRWELLLALGLSVVCPLVYLIAVLRLRNAAPEEDGEEQSDDEAEHSDDEAETP